MKLRKSISIKSIFKYFRLQNKRNGASVMNDSFNAHKSSVSKLLSFCLVSLLSFQPGCGTWSGNPSVAGNNPPAGNSTNGNVSLAILGSGAATQLSATSVKVLGKGGAPIGVLRLTRAQIALKGIKFRQGKEDAEERETFSGPYAVDLLSNSTIPSLSKIALSPGEYKDVQLQIHRLEANQITGISSANPLVDNSIYIEGDYIPTVGSSVHLVIKVDVSEEFSLFEEGSTAGGAKIDAGSNLSIIIAFRLNHWFDFSNQSYDFSDLSGSAVTIDSKGDAIGKGIQEILKEKIKNSADFGEDKDADGNLSPIEDNDDQNDSEAAETSIEE